MSKKDKAVVISIVSDLHTNSTIGLFPGRSFPLDDGGMYYASKAQRWLWDAWEDYWSIVDRKVKKHKALLWTVFNGDLVDGNHHGTGQICTPNETTQARMANHLLEPRVQKADKSFVVRGTGAHSGPSAAWDEKIAEDLGTQHNPDLEVDGKPSAWSWWVLRFEVNGIGFNIAHHTTRGRRNWTRGNAVNRLAADTLLDYARRKEKPPDIVIRSHVHNYECSHDNHKPAIMAVITPCWQLQTEYGCKIAPDKLPDIGGLIFVCAPDGTYEFEPVLYMPKRTEVYRG